MTRPPYALPVDANSIVAWSLALLLLAFLLMLGDVLRRGGR